MVKVRVGLKTKILKKQPYIAGFEHTTFAPEADAFTHLQHPIKTPTYLNALTGAPSGLFPHHLPTSDLDGLILTCVPGDLAGFLVIIFKVCEKAFRNIILFCFVIPTILFCVFYIERREMLLQRSLLQLHFVPPSR